MAWATDTRAAVHASDLRSRLASRWPSSAALGLARRRRRPADRHDAARGRSGWRTPRRHAHVRAPRVAPALRPARLDRRSARRPSRPPSARAPRRVRRARDTPPTDLGRPAATVLPGCCSSPARPDPARPRPMRRLGDAGRGRSGLLGGMAVATLLLGPGTRADMAGRPARVALPPILVVLPPQGRGRDRSPCSAGVRRPRRAGPGSSPPVVAGASIGPSAPRRAATTRRPLAGPAVRYAVGLSPSRRPRRRARGGEGLDAPAWSTAASVMGVVALGVVAWGPGPPARPVGHGARRMLGLLTVGSQRAHPPRGPGAHPLPAPGPDRRPHRAWPTAATSTNGSRRPSAGRSTIRRHGGAWSSTSTVSRRSTTPSATTPATRCSASSARA